MTPFTAIVRAEGRTGNLRVTVPMPIADQLSVAGVRPPCWAHVVADRGLGPTVFFAHLRFPISRPSMTLTLPRWLFAGLRAGDAITCSVDAATPYRARASDDPAFDWLTYVPPEYLPIETSGQLALWSRREEPGVVTRRPSANELQHALKLYDHSRARRVYKDLVAVLKEKSPERFTTAPG